MYFAKNEAYFPFNYWLSFQRLCRLLWGYKLADDMKIERPHKLPAFTYMNNLGKMSQKGKNSEALILQKKSNCHAGLKKITARCRRQGRSEGEICLRRARSYARKYVRIRTDVRRTGRSKTEMLWRAIAKELNRILKLKNSNASYQWLRFRGNRLQFRSSRDCTTGVYIHS